MQESFRNYDYKNRSTFVTFYRLIDSKQTFCNPAWWMHTHSRQSQFPAWSRITEERLSVKEIDSETEHPSQHRTYSCLARSFVRSFVSLGIPSGRNSSSRLASRWEPRKREREREREREKKKTGDSSNERPFLSRFLFPSDSGGGVCGGYSVMGVGWRGKYDAR